MTKRQLRKLSRAYHEFFGTYIVTNVPSLGHKLCDKSFYDELAKVQALYINEKPLRADDQRRGYCVSFSEYVRKKRYIARMALDIPQKIVAYNGDPEGLYLYIEQREEIAQALYELGYRKQYELVKGEKE